MPKKEVPLKTLADYLPDNSCDEVLQYLSQYKVHLTITRQRQSILGDYRNAHAGKAHRISVNGNLNKFSFLITLLHELAHLFTFDAHGHKVQPHGKEWKQNFSIILAAFINKKVFPDDIGKALQRTLKNPAASSCGDENLLRVLKNYDANKAGHFMVEQISNGSIFEIKGGRQFMKGEKIKTRYKCVEIATKKYYLFSGLYEVKLVV